MSWDEQSWGRTLRVEQKVVRPFWSDDLRNILLSSKGDVLARGLARSYGDVCVNAGGSIVDMTAMTRMIEFNANTGFLTCESGVSLREIIDVFLPRGWFPPVVPGTKHVTVGGAIANDIHGKNHHRTGTFGSSVHSLKLLRSDGNTVSCSHTENKELFAATIGGLGLTGLIVSATIRLLPVSATFFNVELIKMSGLQEYFELTEESDVKFPYTVAWIDTSASGQFLGRGIFMRAHIQKDANAIDFEHEALRQHRSLHMPMSIPFNVITPTFCRLFNGAYYSRLPFKKTFVRQSYNQYFFPLDGIANWNIAYGRRGFFQYQFVVPTNESSAIARVLDRFRKSGLGCFLSVLKNFGKLPSPGLLSFPMAGPTLTLDFHNDGKRSLKLMDDLDAIIGAAGGRVYPAKDARMSPDFFWATNPKAKEFAKFIDPRFSSSFWRRINQRGAGEKV